MFWRLALATCWRLTSVAKNACSAFRRQFFKTFSVFPSNFYDYSLSSPFLSQLKLTQTLFKLHFCIISSRVFKKRYGFSLSHFIFNVLSLVFLFLWVYWGHYVFCQMSWSFKGLFYLDDCSLFKSKCFDFITDVCMLSRVCALFHDSDYFIHIMFMTFYHIICHLNPCNAQWPLDSEVLMFISIIACLVHLSCPCCLWLLVSNLIFLWNLPASHPYTCI